MELIQLEAFLEASQWKSFRRAAEALFLTQPALSDRIKRLERDLGQPLFHRMGRGVSLTEAGKALLPYAERALRDLREGRETLREIDPSADSTLHVGTARVIGTYVLPDVIAHFREQNAIDVHMRSGRSTEVLKMVIEGEVHVGVARALADPQVETVPLYDEEIVLVSHPSHRFAQEGSASIYDVAAEPLILYDRDSFYFLLIDRVCREAGIVPRVLMMLDSIEATKQMVERGLGISFLPRSSIRREVEINIISHIPLVEGHRVTLNTVAILPRKQPRSPMVRAFLKTLRETLPPASGASGNNREARHRRRIRSQAS
ncbi:MAG: LysR family transcriptional regulator [Dehalococcoidia bacterium]